MRLPRFHSGEERTLKNLYNTVFRAVVRSAALAVIVAAAWCGVGCAGPPVVPDVDVELALDSETYQVGQPVIVSLTVRNRSDQEILVPALDATTLRFRLTRAGSGELITRDPVLPDRSLSRPRVLGPLEATRRRFLFTRLTAEPGEWGLIVGLYDCMYGTEQGAPVPTLFSVPARFTVVDEVMFGRDPYSGIITKAQATELAREAAGADADVPARAVLTPLGDSGLHRWVVLLGGGEDPVHEGQAFEVNPYTGKASRLALAPGPKGGGGE